MGVLQIFVSSILGVVLEDERLEVFLLSLDPLLLRARGTRIDHTNEREHLRLVTRLRIWGRSSESFAREWDRGRRFDWLPELAIPGRGHADFSLEGFAKGHFRLIAEKLGDRFYLDVVLE